MPLALFGITNEGLNLAVNLLILFLVVVWIALVAWTYFDARRRIEDRVLVGAATVASLFPFVGSIVYSILRPPEFLEDARERELETRAAELRVRQLEEQSCPNCAYPIERSFLRCPNCRARVKDPCESCGKPIDPRWSLCPYCEAPSRRAAQARRAAQEGKAPKGREPSRKAAEGERKAPERGRRGPQPRRRKPKERPAATAPEGRKQSSRPPSRSARPEKESAPSKERPAPTRKASSRQSPPRPSPQPGE
jgi:membrane peptidoglycan carboxypeptidase